MKNPRTQAITEIIHFYDRPWWAKVLIDRAIAENHLYFRDDHHFNQFLESERKAFERRKKSGSKNPEVLLTQALDLREEAQQSDLPGFKSGFELMVWQERVGPY